MHALTTLIEIDFPHRAADGTPSATLENIEAIIEAFGVVIARPPLNADSFTPFFPGRFHACSPEMVRDTHLAWLHDICARHGIKVGIRALARHLQMLGLEQEDAERQAANAGRLHRGAA